jgi:hypothetical protein
MPNHPKQKKLIQNLSIRIKMDRIPYKMQSSRTFHKDIFI